MNSNIYQRLFYFICFLCLVFSQFYWGIKPVSFKDWIFFVLICLPFIYQIFYNNKIGWILLIGLTIIHLLLTAKNSYESDALIQIPFILILYVLAGIVLYFLKPIYKKTSK